MALRLYIAVVAAVGIAWLAYLAPGVDWTASTLGEMGLLVLLMVLAGSFPLPVGPRVKADVTTAVWFSAALLLDPGAAALTGVVGVVTYTALIRFWGQRLRLPWYKYPFNAGQVALLMGVTSMLFRSLEAGGDPITLAVVPAAAAMYLVNTSLVSGAVSLQLRVNALNTWWKGTKENGLTELSLYSFGFLGAVVYHESPWTVVALFLPVAIVYLAFSRLAGANAQLERMLEELERLQGRIVSTSKLASVGAISLDLAHQIKNPLAIVLGRLEGLEDRLEAGTRARHHLDAAMQAGRRIEELTGTFASIGQQRWVQLNVPDVLDEAFGMAALHLRTNIDTRRLYDEGLPKIRGNPVLIREALTNVFSNSLEAVGDGGFISIKAYHADGVVKVRISDNGMGIPADRMVHMFEPFQSTRAHGQGLGLFACKYIIEMHGGSVEVHSVEGAGTTVTLILPVAPSADEDLEVSPDSLLTGSLRS